MIITLCGSARFEPEFHEWNKRLTLQGHVVLSLAVFPSFHQGNKNWYTAQEKLMLDAIHKRKIEISDAILVINPGGYIGESTISEMIFANQNKKRILRTYAVPFRDFSFETYKVCQFGGCSDSIGNIQPCALCYE